MNVRLIARALLLPAICVFSMAASSGPSGEVIAQYGGSSPGNAGGHSVTLVALKDLATSQAGKFAIPNDEPKGKAESPKPKKEIDDAVKKLSVGQYVKAGVAITNLGPTLVSIEAYDLKPGEDSKNGYVFSKIFEKSTGKMTARTVVLSKFGKEYSFTIPTKKGDNGVEEDPDIVAALGKLTEGGSVWVQATGSKLIIIEPYTEPSLGKLVKIGDTEIDGHKVPSAEVETEGGKTVTLLVPVKPGKLFAVDTTVKSQLLKLKPNTDIEYRAHEDGDKLWIREIGVAPKEKKPTDMAKADPAKKDAPKAK